MGAITESLKPHQADVEAIADIYRLRFPGHRIKLVLSRADNPVRGECRVIRKPDDVPQRSTRKKRKAKPLATHWLETDVANAPEVTVYVDIPPPPTPAEQNPDGGVWRPRRKLRWLFAVWPAGYEYLRYRIELRRMTRGRPPEHWQILGPERKLPMPTGPSLPAADARPAILIGFHWLEVGGAEKLAFDTVHWAFAAGLRVFVVAGVPELQRLAHRLPQHPDVTFIRLDRYLSEAEWPLYLEALIRRENIRLIHNHHCGLLYASLPHLRVRTPWVTVLDSTHITEYGGGGFPRVSGVWSHFIDTHHVISGQLISFFQERFGIAENVLLGRMLDGAEGPDQLPPMTLDPDTGRLSLCFVGRMFYQKRPIVVVETLRALAKWASRNGVTLEVTLVGDGPFRPAVQRLIDRHGLTDLVTMKAGSSDVPALLRASDILLLPSNNEGLALVCYEAIQEGCIPISTDVGSQAEIVPADLLLPLNPFRTVRQTVKAVDRLWRDAAFRHAQQTALQDNYRRLAADPTAQDVLMPIYREAANLAGDRNE